MMKGSPKKYWQIAEYTVPKVMIRELKYDLGELSNLGNLEILVQIPQTYFLSDLFVNAPKQKYGLKAVVSCHKSEGHDEILYSTYIKQIVYDMPKWKKFQDSSSIKIIQDWKRVAQTMLLSREFPHLLVYQAIDPANHELLDTKEKLPKGFVKTLVDKAKIQDEK